MLIDIPVKPPTAEEYDRPFPKLENYSISEQLDYWRSRPNSIKYMHDTHLEAYLLLCEKYGKDAIDEILASCEEI